MGRTFRHSYSCITVDRTVNCPQENTMNKLIQTAAITLAFAATAASAHTR